jgi:ATP-binding cassette subfamily F protein 3
MIQLQNLAKQYGSKVLFEGGDARIGPRTRMALVGPNGAGKSTLIRMILGQEEPDSGRVSRVKHLAIGHLAQEVPKLLGRNVLSEVMRLDGRREELLAARVELEESLSKVTEGSEESHQEDLERYGRVLEELEGLDEYRLESRAKAILMGMGFKAKDFERSLTEFSGGWLMRVALSRILLMEPDLLLLDEPTNHLDLESLLWLEDFLRGFRGAMLLVSHDTAFLNRLVTEVLEIDQKTLTTYRGNYQHYVGQKAERLEILKAQKKNQDARIAELEGFIERFGAKATKAAQAQSRVKQLEKIERIELPDDRATVKFRFPPAPPSGREVVTLKGAALHYGEKVVFEGLNSVIQKGSRMAIVGRNGAGKTTLLKLLSGKFAPSAGEVKHGHHVQVGYYAQLQAETLDMGKTILQELEATAPDWPLARVRAIAGAFLFTGDDVEKKCGVLSGGEKARVALAKLLLSPANFLILDEPTNHLDVASREMLLESLQNFDGTLVLVSHDRDFVGPLVTSVLEIEPSEDPKRGSSMNQILGGYEDYLARKIREAELATKSDKPAKLSGAAKSAAAASAPGAGGNKGSGAGAAASVVSPSPAAASSPAAGGKPAVSNNQRNAWDRERLKIEGEIEKLEAERGEVGALLADPETYADKAKSMPLLERHRKVERDLEVHLARWEELCGLLA